MNIEAYLTRIGLAEYEIIPNLENLRNLQRQHLLNVPFENLQIHFGEPIVLDEEKIYDKVVQNKRGGFCYELNGLFYILLEAIGYQNVRLSARVYSGDGNFGQEFDHFCILTQVDSERYLVDVGFGDFSAQPLKFVLDQKQLDSNGEFLIRKFDERYFEVVRKEEDAYVSQYIFSLKSRKLSEFEEMCTYHQTSPESSFTQKKVCSLMTDTGRKTLTTNKFIETHGSEKKEIDIDFEKDFFRILKREFHIEL